MNTLDLKKTYLGIELGSTRIKAVLTDDTFSPVAEGFFEWENDFKNGYFTYSLESIHRGVKECFKSLSDNLYAGYGTRPASFGAIGISGMMHGYLAFDENDSLLTPFRTWRNTTTAEATDRLSDAFGMNIGQRWSISHLYQAILNNEEHITKIAHITTLAGYIHYLLTGRWELGVCDASGMFPVSEGEYDKEKLEIFARMISAFDLPWKLENILPRVRLAGEDGAVLTKDGARFLDPTGTLLPGVPLCPPEGDAGTGMVATNSVAPGTGNVSAGTSVFSMLVLKKALEKRYSFVDTVSTPNGAPVAMVHCNNCSGELDFWVNIFDELTSLFGAKQDRSTLYNKLYNHALTGDSRGIIAYNYLSGEHATDISSGKPMCFRFPDTKVNLAGFMRSQLFSSIATLSLGMKTLLEKEGVKADNLCAHGGLFKVKGVAQRLLASAVDSPVSVTEAAGEGGAWGMALLAAYMVNKNECPLDKWLDESVFAGISSDTVSPDKALADEFDDYLCYYKKGLEGERILGEI